MTRKTGSGQPQPAPHGRADGFVLVGVYCDSAGLRPLFFVSREGGQNSTIRSFSVIRPRLLLN